MTKFTRLLSSACITVAALGLLSDSALSLRSIQLSRPGAAIGIGGPITFEDESGFLRAVCASLTLHGSFNERIPKTTGSSTGSVTSGTTFGCRAFGFANATVTILAEVLKPFAMVYNSILGTLPNITGIRTITRGAAFQIVVTGRTCLYEGETGFLFEDVSGSMERGRFLEEGTRLVREKSTAECPAVGRLRGSVLFEPRTVTLV